MSCKERSFDYVAQIRAFFPNNNFVSLPSQLGDRIIKKELVNANAYSFFIPFKKSSAKVTEEYNNEDNSYKITLKWAHEIIDHNIEEIHNILKNNTLSFMITVFGEENYLARTSDDNYTFSCVILDDIFTCTVEICNASGLQLVL